MNTYRLASAAAVVIGSVTALSACSSDSSPSCAAYLAMNSDRQTEIIEGLVEGYVESDLSGAFSMRVVVRDDCQDVVDADGTTVSDILAKYGK